jgi:hypothetical protein
MLNENVKKLRFEIKYFPNSASAAEAAEYQFDYDKPSQKILGAKNNINNQLSDRH